MYGRPRPSSGVKPSCHSGSRPDHVGPWRSGAAGGSARGRRVIGSDQLLAYGVLNDQLNGDGSHVPMNVP